jgi:hypothetical protein
MDAAGRCGPETTPYDIYQYNFVAGPRTTRGGVTQQWRGHMRIETIAGVVIALTAGLGWWFFRDPALATMKIERLVTASRNWLS